MYELIKLTQQTLNDEVVNTVNARDLHENLEISTRYNDWIKNRIDKYGFIENQDYICLGQNCPTQTSSGKQGVSFRYEYFITLDMAKELAMVERNQKGKEARKYFIECEKKLHKAISAKQQLLLDIFDASDDMEKALAINAYEVGYVKPLEQFKEQALPKVSYYDNVLMSPDLVTITQIAKERPRRSPLSSKQSFFAEYYGMTAIDFNKLLESLRIQYKQSKQWLLYHNYAKEGYTQSSTYVTEYGNSKLTTKWTQKGRLFIYEMLKDKGILPVCERSLP